MSYDAARHLVATPAPGGGVRLRARVRFHDEKQTFIEADGTARSRPIADQDEFLPTGSPGNGSDDPTEQVLHVFALAPGQSYAVRQLPNSDTYALVLIGEPSDYPGEGDGPNANGTTDRRSRYLIGTLGGEARKLAEINQLHRRVYGRK